MMSQRLNALEDLLRLLIDQSPSQILKLYQKDQPLILVIKKLL